jgi:hypothetical protein
MSLLDLPRDIRSRRKRRSSRMNSRVPVAIEWNARSGTLHFETGCTRVVNSYGCLLVSPRALDLQQRLRVTNLTTQQRAEAVVVWAGVQRPDGWDVGVELVAADLEFWGVEL